MTLAQFYYHFVHNNKGLTQNEIRMCMDYLLDARLKNLTIRGIYMTLEAKNDNNLLRSEAILKKLINKALQTNK